MCYKRVSHAKLLVCFHVRLEVSVDEEEDVEEEAGEENPSDLREEQDGDLSVGAAHSKIKKISFFAISVNFPDTVWIFTSLRVISAL